MGKAAAVPTTQQQAPPVQAPPVQEPPAEQPPAQQEPQKEVKEAASEVEDPSANVTPEALPSIRGKKARVEFRDQNGNVLPESLVAQLQQDGKVSVETRYEYRSRLANGHEADVVDGKVKVAPPHPDVQGPNPETADNEEQHQPVEDIPAPVAGESSTAVEEFSSPEPKPASEGNEATD